MDIQKLIDTMTTEEKVGQMCVPILETSEIEDGIRKCITKYHVGMLRFCPNAAFDGHSEVIGEPNKYRTSPEMTVFLNSVQKMAKIPMFIAVDQEGSIRNDINRDGAFAYSGHMSFGAADDTELTYRVAKAAGEEFKAMGINLVQAPIVDVLSYSGRKTMKSASFGENVDKVSAHALAMMKGYKDAGIATMAKHFPGYGSVATDAHKGLAEIFKSFEELDNTDIKPMKILFQHGVNGVMTGHVLTHCVDEEYPATMSQKMITGYLREKLGFDGIVETDAMRMPAIYDRYGTASASVMAVNAGCDLVLLRGNTEHFEEGYFGILDAVRNGTISIETINKSVERILKQKNEIGILDNPYNNESAVDKIVGCSEHKAIAKELAQKSVSLLKTKDLPLANNKKILTVCVEPQKILAANDDIQCVDMLYKSVQKIYPNSNGIVVKMQTSTEEIKEVNDKLNDCDVVILGTCNAILYEGQQRLVDAIFKSGKTVIVVAMDSPYDIEVMPQTENYICTYGVAAESANAAVDIICGKLSGNTASPVTINIF